MRNKLFIAYRLLRSKEESRFISIVTLSSIIAISIGIAAVIIVLSVMNGFESEIHQRILQLNSHITISIKESASDSDDLIERLRQIDEIKKISQDYQAKGLIESNKKTSAVMVKSFNANLQMDDPTERIKSNSIDRSELIIGEGLAQSMNLILGDRISLTIPSISKKGKVSFSNNQTFEIVPGTLYALNAHDEHILSCDKEMKLACVFNPPIKGDEVHNKQGAYEID